MLPYPLHRKRFRRRRLSRPLLPYLATMMATVLLIAFWPELTLIVPNALGLR